MEKETKTFQTNQKLIDFFNKYDYTQKEFSEKIKMRTGTFRDYINHKKEIKFSRLEEVFKTFNLTLTINQK